MNTTDSNPKVQFLLSAGLDLLHQESQEWLDTISFWKDEIKFFDKLLDRSEPIEANLKVYRSMLDHLEKLHGDFLNQLYEDVIDHEKLLAKLEKKEQGLAHWDYREKHRRLNRQIHTMSEDIKAFKKVVFGYVKNL